MVPSKSTDEPILVKGRGTNVFLNVSAIAAILGLTISAVWFSSKFATTVNLNTTSIQTDIKNLEEDMNAGFYEVHKKISATSEDRFRRREFTTWVIRMKDLNKGKDIIIPDPPEVQ